MCKGSLPYVFSTENLVKWNIDETVPPGWSIEERVSSLGICKLSKTMKPVEIRLEYNYNWKDIPFY